MARKAALRHTLNGRGGVSSLPMTISRWNRVSSSRGYLLDFTGFFPMLTRLLSTCIYLWSGL